MKNVNSLMVKILGVAFAIVGFLKMGGFISTEFRNIFSLSLAGFFFVLFDLCSFIVDKTNRYTVRRTLFYARIASLVLSIMAIIIVPLIPIKWNTPFLKVITDSLVYLSLGIAIYLIGSKEVTEWKKSNISDV